MSPSKRKSHVMAGTELYPAGTPRKVRTKKKKTLCAHNVFHKILFTLCGKSKSLLVHKVHHKIPLTFCGKRRTLWVHKVFKKKSLWVHMSFHKDLYTLC